MEYDDFHLKEKKKDVKGKYKSKEGSILYEERESYFRKLRKEIKQRKAVKSPLKKEVAEEVVIDQTSNVLLDETDLFEDLFSGYDVVVAQGPPDLEVIETDDNGVVTVDVQGTEVNVCPEYCPEQKTLSVNSKEYKLKMRMQNVQWYGFRPVDQVTVADFCVSIGERQASRPKGALKVLVSAYSSCILYAVFDESRNSFIKVELERIYCAAIMEQMACRGLFREWYVIDAKMLKSVVVAQGICHEVVHWLDDRLPESKFVVRDEGVGSFVLDEWRSVGEWPAISGKEFAVSIPAIGHIECNWCDHCGGVDMCRHILMDIVGDSCVDLSLWMPMAVRSVYALLMMRDNPMIVSLSSSHIRYAIARSLAMRFTDLRLVYWQKACEVMCMELYPHRVVAQTLFADAYAMMTASFTVLWDLFMYIPKKAGDAVSDLLKFILSKMHEYLVSGAIGFVHAVMDAILDEARMMIDGFAKLKPLAVSLVKTLVRVAVGYDAMSVLLEMAWDSEVVSGACDLLRQFLPGAFGKVEGVVPQGVEDFGAVVGALGIALFVGFGRCCPNYRFMSDLLMAMIASAAAFNRGQLWDQFKALKAWFDGDSRLARMEVLRTSFPASIDMIELHEVIVRIHSEGESVASLQGDLGSFYARYLNERRRFGRDAPEMMQLCGPALQYIRSNDIQAVESVRRRPASIVIWGDSNIGKSRLVSRIADSIAFKHRDRYSPNGTYSSANAIFNVNLGDDYASGYDSQDIWVFDEWFQEKDLEMKPSKSVSMMFTLVSTMPNRLNMAAVDDKGKFPRVSLVLAATNSRVDDNSLKSHVKSIHYPEALATRIKYRVKPVLKPGFCVFQKRICALRGDKCEMLGDAMVPEKDLYEFEITSYGDCTLRGDLANGRFSWGALLSLADDEYVKSRDRVGIDDVLPSNDFADLKYDSYGNVVGHRGAGLVDEKEEEHCVAQGFSDWFGLSKLWSDESRKTQYCCPLTLEILDGSFDEVDESSSGASHVIKRYRGPGSSNFQFIHPEHGVLNVEGIMVWVKPRVSYSAETLGLGLMMAVIGIIAAVPIAKKLVAKTRELKDVAEVVVDGIAYKMRGDSACTEGHYEPEGHMVTAGGKSYFVVSTKNGYASYPQGVDNEMLKLIGNQRTVEQIPIIYDSIFSIVNNKLLMGNAFAVTDSRLLLPLHIARSLQQKGGVISNGKISVSLPGQCGVVSGFHIEELGDDVAVLCLDAAKLNGIRNNIKKLSKNTPSAGLCRQVFRDAQQALHTFDGTFAGHDQSVEYASNGYEYKIAKKNVRSTTIGGFAGMCGAVYINRGDSVKDNVDGGVILGIHVAADETKQRRLFRIFDEVTFSLNALFSTHYPPLEGVANGLGVALGFESARAPHGGKVFTEGRLGKTTVPPCVGAQEYDVAHLLPFEQNGGECDVMLKGLGNLRDFSARTVAIPEKVVTVVDYLCEKLSKEAVISNPDWVGTYNGAGLLPSITRKTAAGYPLNQLGPTKGVVCLSDAELASLGITDKPLPSDEAISMLDDLVDRILSGKEFEAACTLSTKEEARSSTKVLEGKTRLFAGAPVHEFLLQRRFFMGVMATFLKKNIGVNSALGLEPADFDKMHDYLINGFKDPWILTADHNSMDQRFSPVFINLVGRVIRSIALGKPVGDEIVSDEDYIRQVLIRRLAFNRFKVGSEIIEPKGGHPSGSCLTTIFNIIADIIIFTYAFWEMMGGTLEDLEELIRMIFLGDDSIVCAENGSTLDLKVLQRCANECGFSITSADKVSALGWFKPYDRMSSRSEYNFLGRFFTTSDGVLDIDRLSKMLQFVEERKLVEVIPQAIISHREEVARYYRTGQFDWCKRVMPQLEFFGFHSIEKYISMSIPDLQQQVLSTLLAHPEKQRVIVPQYNRRKIVAQGPGDGEPSETENLGDAEFVASMGENVMVNDLLQADYLRDHMDSVNFAAAEIFSRPYAAANGSTGVFSDEMILQLSAASSYFFHNFNAQAKLANTVYMRCKFCVKIIVASGPYVTGKLLLAFNPGPNPPLNVFQAAGCPCTELDLASAKSAVVKYDTVMPGNWMMVENFINPALITSWTPGFDYGCVSLWTITPISESVVFTAYIWLEEVELRGVGFTDFSLTPQGNDKYPVAGSKSAGKERMNDKTDKFHHVSKDYKGELEMMQWKWKVENTPGWLNTTAASVETTAGCVETVESSILGPVGDFINKVGDAVGFAALFGACAPNPNPHFETFMQSPNWAQAQMICPVPAIRLAVVQNQKSVIPRTLFGNMGDEMNIREYVSRMGILSRIPWSGADMPGTTLAQWNVMPGVTPGAPVLDGAWSITPTPLAFVAGTFRLWRGSIKYRLSPAKSAFHTGTLEVVWQMGFTNSSPASPSQDALTQRYIWDVTQSSSLEFEVPYVARTPWTQIYFTPFETSILASDLTTGRLFLNVINPLANSSGAVASSINIVLYVSGGSDIEFAMPGRHLQLTGYSPGPPALAKTWGPEAKRKAKRVVVAQGGPYGDDATTDGLSTKVLERLRDVPYPSAWAHLTTTGERVLSLRMLIKRFSEGVPIATDMNFNTVLLNSWYCAYISLGFTFWTGSWRAMMNITTTDFDSAPLPLTWQLVWNNTYAGPTVQAGEAHMSIAPWSNATVLEVPWYSPQAFRIISDAGACALNGPSPATSLVEYAAGDDLAYGFQVGLPIIFYSDTMPEPLY